MIRILVPHQSCMNLKYENNHITFQIKNCDNKCTENTLDFATGHFLVSGIPISQASFTIQYFCRF